MHLPLLFFLLSMLKKSGMAININLQNDSFKGRCFPFSLVLMHGTFQVGYMPGEDGQVR